MAYTPINWQTGDTITADKLNRCDNGWAVESSSQQLFSETVTTVDSEGINSGVLSYASQIGFPAINVTFDGTSYTCVATEEPGPYYSYGAPWGEQGPDFSEFPFTIESTTDGNNLYTETAGTYTVSVVGASIVTSAEFEKAVKASIPVLRVILGTTTFQEAAEAIYNGWLVYGWDDDNARVFYAVGLVEDEGTPEYGLYALTRTSSGFAPTTVEYTASSPTDPLYAS